MTHRAIQEHERAQVCAELGIEYAPLGGWRAGQHKPGLVLELMTETDLQRVGHCWMRGRLKIGDRIMCLKHSGDCFWQYVLLEHYGDDAQGNHLYQLNLKSEFGAYVLGTPIKWQPSDREMLLLMAGERITVAPVPHG